VNEGNQKALIINSAYREVIAESQKDGH